MNTVTMPQVMTLQASPSAHSEGSALIHMIERVARDPGVDLGRLEKLMEMHERVTAQRARTAYSAALSALQAKLPVIAERGKIEIRAKDAKGERSGAVQQSTSYALWEDINEAIKGPLSEHGFALSFRTGLADDGRIKVTAILSHAEGHQEETTMVLPHDSTGSKNAVQAIGSSTSYGKRYTASALLNLTSRGEDDDGKRGGGDFITEEQVHDLSVQITETKSDITKFLKFFKIEALSELPAPKLAQAVAMLNAKRRPA